MGDDQCGYLTLFIKTESYNTILNSAPLVCPTNSGLFAASPLVGLVTQDGGPLPLTASDIATKKISHNELLRQYNEAQSVKTALRKQIIESMDEVYLQPLRDSATDMIQYGIPEFLVFYALHTVDYHLPK